MGTRDRPQSGEIAEMQDPVVVIIAQSIIDLICNRHHYYRAQTKSAGESIAYNERERLNCTVCGG
jgi:predicted ATP-grasp superfamily ATP-dependent carboligase